MQIIKNEKGHPNGQPVSFIRCFNFLVLLI